MIVTRKEIRKYSLNDVITFGKYKGKTIKDIINIDKNYMHWAVITAKIIKLDKKANKYFNLKPIKLLDFNNDQYYLS